ELRRARIADIDGGEVLRRAFVGEPQDAAPVLGDLDRHALADPAEPVELVVCQLPKIPNRRVCHLSTPFEALSAVIGPFYAGDRQEAPAAAAVSPELDRQDGAEIRPRRSRRATDRAPAGTDGPKVSLSP